MKWLRFITLGAEPDRCEEPAGMYGLYCGEPENLLRGDSHGLSNGKKPSLGIHDHQHAELFLPEQAFAFPGDGELKIFFDFFLPDGETFVTEVDFEEGSRDPRGGYEFHVPIRYEAKLFRERLREKYPSSEGDPGGLHPAVFQRAIDFIDGELMGNKEVGDKHGIVPSPWSSYGYAKQSRAARRQ